MSRMTLLPTLLVFLCLLPLCRGIRSRQRRGLDAQAMRLYRWGAGVLGGAVLASMAAQEAILYLAGQLSWATALPLHLCSLMGFLALPALITRRETLLHTLLLLGAPGAALAIIFPAVADTPWPRLTGFFFALMHAGIFLAPLLPLSLGWRPRALGAAQAGLLLLAAGTAALIANRLTGGNYLFLAGPVAGTPLVLLSRWGRGVYLLMLALLAALLLGGEAVLIRIFSAGYRRNATKITEMPGAR